MAQAKQIESKIQLLVEGKDHLNFFEALIEHLSLENVQIQDFGGVNELRSFLPALVNMPNFHEIVESIGIVRDAESSSEGAFQSVQTSLTNAKLSVPHNLEEPTATLPKVTVLILPGNNRQGMLETLLCESFAGFLECSLIIPKKGCDEHRSAFLQQLGGVAHQWRLPYQGS